MLGLEFFPLNQFSIPIMYCGDAFDQYHSERRIFSEYGFYTFSFELLPQKGIEE